MEPIRILITGARGLLGTPTVAAFRSYPHADVIGLGRHELDITDAEHVRSSIGTFKPRIVVNCAGYTKVDDCETHAEHASNVNGLGAGHVAKAAAEVGAYLIHLSTDYVFDGSATAPMNEEHPVGKPSALSAYGRSKLEGEQRVLKYHASAAIIRTAWLYGPDGPCFPKSILAQAGGGWGEGGGSGGGSGGGRRVGGRGSAIGRGTGGPGGAAPLRVVDDQQGTPTYAPDLAQAICELARLEAPGLFHITNEGHCTWHEFAQAIIKAASLDKRVTPITTEAAARRARRPAYSVLDNTRYHNTTGHKLRSWQEALAEFVELS